MPRGALAQGGDAVPKNKTLKPQLIRPLVFLVVLGFCWGIVWLMLMLTLAFQSVYAIRIVELSILPLFVLRVGFMVCVIWFIGVFVLWIVDRLSKPG